MKNWLAVLLSVCLLSGGVGQRVYGVEKTKAATTRSVKVQVPASQKHSLWKVKGKENTVYLLGSVHVLRKDSYPLPALMEAAYTNSGISVFETDIGKLDDPNEAMKLMAKAQLPEGKTL